jgi:hypothetical protein
MSRSDGGGDTSGSEHVGDTSEPWSPVGLVCSGRTLLGGLLFNAFKNEGCNDPRTEQPDAFRITTTAGLGTLGIACAFV